MIAAAIFVALLLILAVIRLVAVYLPPADLDDPNDYCADDTRNPENDK